MFSRLGFEIISLVVKYIEQIVKVLPSVIVAAVACKGESSVRSVCTTC